ncbi:hypothetical protein [Wenjunlia tyrosinilytica]|uniref:hypothetical protein n=1 Tax=Wenjunlia tyrosinilytica TaxID=1544741 RepID=UPI00166DAA87|nr:hypothetical protein [Wenjunlia tyrosinilytica]
MARMLALGHLGEDLRIALLGDQGLQHRASGHAQPVRDDRGQFEPTCTGSRRRRCRLGPMRCCTTTVRLTERAAAARDEAALLVAHDAPHIWHLFDSLLPESSAALQALGEHISRHTR